MSTAAASIKSFLFILMHTSKLMAVVQGRGPEKCPLILLRSAVFSYLPDPRGGSPPPPLCGSILLQACFGGRPGLPGVECQADGDDTVGHKHPEVLTHLGAAEDGLASPGRYCKQQMEEECAREGVGDSGLGHGSSPDEQGGNGKGPHLLMAVVGVQRPDVLQEDQLPPGREHRGEDDGQNPVAVHVDPGNACDMAVLTDGPELLAQFGPEEGPDGHGQSGNHQESDHRDPHEKARLDLPEPIQGTLQPEQVDGVAQTRLGGNPQLRVVKWNQGAQQKQE